MGRSRLIRIAVIALGVALIIPMLGGADGLSFRSLLPGNDSNKSAAEHNSGTAAGSSSLKTNSTIASLFGTTATTGKTRVDVIAPKEGQVVSGRVPFDTDAGVRSNSHFK